MLFALELSTPSLFQDIPYIYVFIHLLYIYIFFLNYLFIWNKDWNTYREDYVRYNVKFEMSFLCLFWNSSYF